MDDLSTSFYMCSSLLCLSLNSYNCRALREKMKKRRAAMEVMLDGFILLIILALLILSSDVQKYM